MKLTSLLPSNKVKQNALKYLLDWGESFWKETDYRVKEVTEKLETDIKRNLSAAGKFNITPLVEISMSGGKNLSNALSKEEKSEITNIGQRAVNNIQISDLTNAMLALNDVLEKKNKYIICIDKLDENWVDDLLRYKLIKSLLQTARDFHQKVPNVKIIITVREDLIDRVFRFTRDFGYQEEKYNSLKLFVRWQPSEIKDMLNLRVNHLIKQQYTDKTVDLEHILPKNIKLGNKMLSSTQFIIDRTMLNPRDAIVFFNECLKAAEGSAEISKEHLLKAEAAYSTKRLRSLADEWIADYKTLFELGRVCKL